jgi:hypothetical protein
MNKLFFIFLLLSFSIASLAKSNQITLTYSIHKPNSKKYTYWSLYFDILNEKVSEVFSNELKEVQFVITYNDKSKMINYIDYTKMILFKSSLNKVHKAQGSPTVKYILKDDCTAYLYKKNKVNISAKCFQEKREHLHFKEINTKQYTRLLFAYLDKMGPKLDKIPLIDSILKYEITKTKDGEVKKIFKKFNFQVMGRNGLKLPKNTLLTRVKPQKCFHTDCFGTTKRND